jgi:predicted GIY-YIG superfamily endonuclease
MTDDNRRGRSCKHLLVIEQWCVGCKSYVPYNPAATEHRYESAATAVYRLSDEDGELLYVGLTNNPERRFAQHAKEKHWWPQVANVETIFYPSRIEAEVAEDWAIFEEKPIYNKTRNIDQHANRIYRRRGRTCS